MLFIALLLFLSPLQSFAQVSCSETFKRSETSSIKAFSAPKEIIQSGEVESVGRYVSSKNFQKEVEKILQREGTYPLFITSQKTMMISHRLPKKGKIKEGDAFLATHRGLYNRYTEMKDAEPLILFSGELRVVGGRAVSLIDQSKTFHEPPGRYRGGVSVEALIDKNQVRLDFAVEVLGKWGLVDQRTEVKNFWYIFKGYEKEERYDGHMKARQVSLFEMKCRSSQSCWKTVQRLQSVLKRIDEQGGAQLFSQKLNKLPADKWLAEISILTSMMKEGVIDVMARPQMSDSPHFKNLLRQLDFIENALLGP